MTSPSIPDRVPAGATPEGDGIITGDGRVRVDAFIDFLCPFCRQFELSTGATLLLKGPGGLPTIIGAITASALLVSGRRALKNPAIWIGLFLGIGKAVTANDRLAEGIELPQRLAEKPRRRMRLLHP